MARSRLEVIDGKALFDGRTLATWADDRTARIFQRTEATKVVVFGSEQRGDSGPDSNLDLLAVFPTVTRRHDDAVRVLRELRHLPVTIDVSVVDEATFEREATVPGLIRVARRERRLVERAA
ncbi:MAG: nucleotidyltransferase domain-containing protein [Ilumatobacteraceae bacterium]